MYIRKFSITKFISIFYHTRKKERKKNRKFHETFIHKSLLSKHQNCTETDAEECSLSFTHSFTHSLVILRLFLTGSNFLLFISCPIDVNEKSTYSNLLKLSTFWSKRRTATVKLTRDYEKRRIFIHSMNGSEKKNTENTHIFISMERHILTSSCVRQSNERNGKEIGELYIDR